MELCTYKATCSFSFHRAPQAEGVRNTKEREALQELKIELRKQMEYPATEQLLNNAGSPH